MRMSKDEVLISDYYCDHKYHFFLDYCENHHLKTMGDLKRLDFNCLLTQKGIGISKMVQILNHYNDFYDVGFVFKTKNNKQKTVVFESVHKDVSNLSIRVLTTFKIKSNLVIYLESNGIDTIGKLKGYSILSLSDAIGARMATKIADLNETFTKPVIEILTDFVNHNKNRVYYDVYIRRSHGDTLQDIALDMGITRERVRQIELHFFKQIQLLCERIGMCFIDSKGYIQEQDLKKICNDQDIESIVRYTLKRSDLYEYLNFASLFLLSRKGDKTHKDCFLEIASDIIDGGFDIVESTDDLRLILESQGYGFISIASFYQLLKMNGYHNYGPFIIKGSQSYAYLCAKIIEKDYPEGIKLYDHAALDGLRKKVWDKFGTDVQLPVNDRAFSARLSECLVLSGRGAVIAPKNISISMTILDEIVQYIDNYETSMIYYSEIFARFKEVLLETSTVTNYNYLHGVLMLYYPQRYDYSRDYLTHKLNISNNIPLNVRIKNYINEKNQPVSKKELQEKFIGISDVVINRMVSEDPDLIQWENRYYSTRDLLHITDEEIALLKGLLDSLLDRNDGYCAGEVLYCEVQKQLPTLITKNNIKNSTNMFYMTQQLFNQYYQFRRPHIGRKDVPFDITAKNIALHFLDAYQRISYEKFKHIVTSFKWPEATSAIVFTDIVRDYVRINEDEYIHKDYFKLSKQKLEEIETTLDKALEGNIYIAINRFDQYELLPKIGYLWNMYLLRDILNHYSTHFNIIDVQVLDRRFEKGIITRRDSEFKDLAHLVAYLLKRDHYQTIEESKMLFLLNDYGFMMKDIPLELFNSKYLTYKDGVFTVSNNTNS